MNVQSLNIIIIINSIACSHFSVTALIPSLAEANLGAVGASVLLPAYQVVPNRASPFVDMHLNSFMIVSYLAEVVTFCNI